MCFRPKQNKPKYEYDINGYRKDHREQNVRYKSQFEDDFNYDNGRADRDWIDVKSNNYFSGNASSVDKGKNKESLIRIHLTSDKFRPC